MPDDRLSASVVIPTLNRPADLERCLLSITAQTRLPREVLVIDDGCLDPAPLERIFAQSPIRFIYVRKNARGAARSRNIGASRSTADIVVFVDDDTELDPGYIEGFLTIFEADPERTIGGLSGAPTRFRNGVELPSSRPATWTSFLDRFFLLESSPGGRVLLSGSRSAMNNPGILTPVEFLQGCNMAVRRAVFDEFRFEEALDLAGDGYALGEDVIFSYGVGRQYRLYSTQRARLKHFASAGNRPDKQRMNRMRVIHDYHFMHVVMRGGLLNHLAFAWSMFGLSFIHLLVLLRRPGRVRWRNLTGVLSGIGYVLSHPSGRLS